MSSQTPRAVSLPLHIGLDERKGGAGRQSALFQDLHFSLTDNQGDDKREEGGPTMVSMTNCLKERWFNLLSAFRGQGEEVQRRQQAF